jgi:NADPH-dependent curcumin reductase CurA
MCPTGRQGPGVYFCAVCCSVLPRASLRTIAWCSPTARSTSPTQKGILMVKTNRQILLASRPNGEPTLENFHQVEGEIPRPGPGQMLLRSIFLSLDPYMRGRMNAAKSYAPPVEIGQVMEGRAVAEVIESNLTGYQRGDTVFAPLGWQEYAVSDGQGVRIIDQSLRPLSYALGILGMPGMTAYTGLLNIGQPQPGETLVVAAASGAVGSIVGQIGRLKGCRIVGIAGGPEKCRFVKGELGFDECLDHREPKLAERLAHACPQGIDIYFENVGGAVFDAVLPLLNNFARIPVCGLIAHYNATELPPGPDRVPLVMQQILIKRLTFRGFIVWDFASQMPQFLADMSEWLREGRLKYKEDITDGLENAPRELIGLLRGKNFGKKIIRVSDEPSENIAAASAQ